MSDDKLHNKTIPLQELEQKVVEVVAHALDIEPSGVGLDASMQQDLDAESLDYVDIAFALEREYKVHFPREDVLERAGQHFGEDKFVKDGLVTDLGLQLLRRAMPEVDPDLVKPGLRASQVPGLFTVRTFVRVLDRLLAAKEQMSRECPQCGGALEMSDVVPELTCAGCAKTVPLPSGDDILFADLVRMTEDEESAP